MKIPGAGIALQIARQVFPAKSKTVELTPCRQRSEKKRISAATKNNKKTKKFGNIWPNVFYKLKTYMYMYIRIEMSARRNQS
jgi:hypothetical protein